MDRNLLATVLILAMFVVVFSIAIFTRAAS